MSPARAAQSVRDGTGDGITLRRFLRGAGQAVLGAAPCRFENRLPEPTNVHWHGVPGDPGAGSARKHMAGIYTITIARPTSVD
jgi:hypothetical protein